MSDGSAVPRPDMAALVAAGDLVALRAAVDHPDPSIRARAADALAGLADGASAPLLREVLRTDVDDHVREEAAVALGRLGDRDAVELLAAALGDDPSAHVREEAAVALGRLGDARATGALQAATGDRTTMVRRAAGEALEGLVRDGAPGSSAG